MSHASHLYHVVFSTKGRRCFLDDETLARAIEYIGGIVRNLKGQLLKGGGSADHVHLALVVPPSSAVADFVGKTKSNSSGWIHRTFPTLDTFGWQDGYASFTVSRSVVPKVIDYISGQQAHHAKTTFQEELLALLERHGVEYDERYIWR